MNVRSKAFRTQSGNMEPTYCASSILDQLIYRNNENAKKVVLDDFITKFGWENIWRIEGACLPELLAMLRNTCFFQTIGLDGT